MLAFLGVIPRWAWEALGVSALIAGIWLSGAWHERTVIQTRTVKQEVQVEKRVIETDHSHDQELADLRAYRASHPLEPVRLCITDPLPTSTAQGQPGTVSTDVQPLPGGNPSVRAEPGPDISSLLNLLALRADEVSAGLRRRQELEP